MIDSTRDAPEPPDPLERWLAGERELSWRPELTRAVLARVRARRRRDRTVLFAATVLLAVTVVLGADVLSGEPLAADAGSWIAVRVPEPPSPEAVVASIGASLGSVVQTTEESRSGGLPAALAALLLLLTLNGAVLVRPQALARRPR